MSKELSYLEAIREALAEEMRRDEKVFVLGEDVDAYVGALGVTQGLYEEFGEARVVDTPISESAIVGISIGASLRGYRPVADMQFADFISCGFDQIVNQAATLRFRYGGRQTVPIVVRAPSGGNVGGALYHSQNPDAWLVHRPGLKVVAPPTPYDAKGMHKAPTSPLAGRRNGRLAVQEDATRLGSGPEISALTMQEKFGCFCAPLLRLTYRDPHPPFSHILEGANLPNADKITDALRKLVAY